RSTGAPTKHRGRTPWIGGGSRGVLLVLIRGGALIVARVAGGRVARVLRLSGARCHGAGPLGRCLLIEEQFARASRRELGNAGYAYQGGGLERRQREGEQLGSAGHGSVEQGHIDLQDS